MLGVSIFIAGLTSGEASLSHPILLLLPAQLEDMNSLLLRFPSGLGVRWSPCGPEHYGPEHLHPEDPEADRFCPTDKPAVDIALNLLQKGGWRHTTENWEDLI